MSEPGLLPSAAMRQDRLWDIAPAWRNLTIAATGLTFVALALPLALQSNDAPPLSPKPAPAPLAAALPHAQTPPIQLAAQIPSQPAKSPVKRSAIPQAAHRAVATPEQHAVAAPEQTASLAAPAAASPAADAAAACPITLSAQAQPMGAGVVIGFEGVLAAQQRMTANERSVGGPISPQFANTPRAIVRTDGSAPGAMSQIVVLPPGMTVGIGDHVAFNGVHRDMTMACGYVPPLVTADLGPASQAQAAADAQEIAP